MKFPDWWSSRFLAAELVAGLLLTLLLAVWCSFFGGASHVDELMRGARIGLYGTLAAICGSLLGFVIATLTILLGFTESARLKVLRSSKHYPVLWKTLLSATKWLALATVAAVVALVVDRDGAQNLGAFEVCFLATLLAALRLARSIWILQNVVALVTDPSRARGPAPA
jgi:hypothetical protein